MRRLPLVLVLVLLVHVFALGATRLHAQPIQPTRPAQPALRPTPPPVEPSVSSSPIAAETSAQQDESGAPPALAQWKPWVLAGAPDRDCPAAMVEGSLERLCAWPTRLQLDVDDFGGTFRAVWRLYSRSVVALPFAPRQGERDGGPLQAGGGWPVEVTVNGETVPVTRQEGRPVVMLEAGAYEIAGRLLWRGMPEALQTPPGVGVVALRKHGAALSAPRLDADGVLWLKEATDADAAPAPAEGDDVRVTITRLLADGQPAKLTTRLVLEVSGRFRTIEIPDVLMPATHRNNAKPFAVESPVALSLLPEGGVAVQAGPGRFVIEITTRMRGPVTQVGPVTAPYGVEAWAFRPAPGIRETALRGVVSVDPATTDLPAAWRGLQAFLVNPGDVVELEQLHRGAPPTRDVLNLRRDIWLDFDGQGATVRDAIQGSLATARALTMLPPGELGRVILNGEDQPLVSIGPEDHVGVLLYQSRTQLIAEARYPDYPDNPDNAGSAGADGAGGNTGGGGLRVSGWNTDFDTAQAVLHLPPGWSLFTAAGVDHVSDSWLMRWDLLELFLLCVITMAAWRLGSPVCAGLLFLFLLLAFQEPGAPRLTWLTLLIGLAGARYIPAGGGRGRAFLRHMAWGVYLAGVVGLGVIGLTFLVKQVDFALAPQLEQPWRSYDAGVARMVDQAVMEIAPAAPAPDGFEGRRAPQKQAAVSAKPKGREEMLQHDPEALVQTGPGLPDWRWRQVTLSWNGPVAGGVDTAGADSVAAFAQTYSLTLLPPAWNRGLCLARGVLLVLAALCVVDRRLFKPWGAGGASALAIRLKNRQGVEEPAGRVHQEQNEADADAHREDKGKPPRFTLRGFLLCLLVGMMCCMTTPKPASAQTSGEAAGHADAFPPHALLEAYADRVLAPSPCFPSCLGFPEFTVRIRESAGAAKAASDNATPLDSGSLAMELTVHAAAQTAFPLPEPQANADRRWQPYLVTVDGQPATGLLRRKGAVWVMLEQGVHTVRLQGPLPDASAFTLAFPFAPQRAAVEAEGWRALGLDPDGGVRGVLRFSRMQQAAEAADLDGSNTAETDSNATVDSKDALPQVEPFFRVTRELVLGLDWRVHTTVERLTAPETPAVVEIPLLAGESVITGGMDVRREDSAASRGQPNTAPGAGGVVTVSFGVGETTRQWRSRLSPVERLELTAAPAASAFPWVETWRLRVAPLWGISMVGAPMTQRFGPDGAWTPTWRPWPGERLVLDVRRPAAAPGEAMTMDAARFVMRVGERLDDCRLEFAVRASKGGRLTVTLPEEAEALALTLNGQPAPFQQTAPGVYAYGVSPGRQEVVWSWRQPRPGAGAGVVTPPAVDLGMGAVNVSQIIETPRDRWVLAVWGEPLMGPAVTFWSYLGAMLLVAWALSRAPWTPLRLWEWFLLGVGLSQVGPWAALLAVAWLPAFGARRTHPVRGGWFLFDVTQLVLAALLAVGLASLYTAVEQGLLGAPAMHVEGNGSTAQRLVWTQDRVDGALPSVGIFSAPLWVYRAVMLAWSLWLAASILRWLRWALGCYTTDGAWRKPARLRRRREEAATPQREAENPTNNRPQDASPAATQADGTKDDGKDDGKGGAGQPDPKA